MRRPSSFLVLRVVGLPALLVAIAACAGAERQPEQTASSNMAHTLTRVIELHGWPCGAVTAFAPETDGSYTVSCGGGQKYTVELDLGRDWNQAERQTGLRPLIDVSHEVTRLSAEDSGERLRATEALAGLGPDGRTATPFLAKALHDPDPSVRAGAARALGAIGPDAATAEPALEAARQDEDEAVSLAASQALDQIRE